MFSFFTELCCRKKPQESFLREREEVPVEVEEQTEDVDMTPVTNFNQNRLMEKLNVYFKKKNEQFKQRYRDPQTYQKHERKLFIEKEGLCWGMALLWAYKKALHDEKWFYDRVEKIITCSNKQILDIENDIEEFINYVQWLQDTRKCTNNLYIGQDNVDELIGLERRFFAETNLFNGRQLKTLLKKHAPGNEIILLSSSLGSSSKNHAVAVAREEKGFLVYNANYHSGRAKFVSGDRSLLQEMRECFFPHVDMKMHKKVPIKINISQFPKKYIDEKKENVTTFKFK